MYSKHLPIMVYTDILPYLYDHVHDLVPPNAPYADPGYLDFNIGDAECRRYFQAEFHTFQL